MDDGTALSLIYAVIFGIAGICSIIRFIKNNEMMDGVENIDGITYLIKDTDVSYVMYKLSSTCISKNIKSKEFEVVGEREGILIFGGVNYTLNSKDIGNSRNLGAGYAYRIKLEQRDKDIIMRVSFEENRNTNWFSGNRGRPDDIINQAYHRFFKEVFDVQVVK